MTKYKKSKDAILTSLLDLFKVFNHQFDSLQLSKKGGSWKMMIKD